MPSWLYNAGYLSNALFHIMGICAGHAITADPGSAQICFVVMRSGTTAHKNRYKNEGKISRNFNYWKFIKYTTL
jgi:hypothetical protein